MFSLNRSYSLLTVLLAASTVGASSMFAQEVPAPPLGSAPATEMTATAAPVVSLVRGAPTRPWGVRVASPFVELAPITPFDVVPVQDSPRAGTDIAMMGVGGAALVVGMLMGGDSGMIIATAGGVIGLVGLFRWLR